jgi:DNA polymerase III subunit epsilon
MRWLRTLLGGLRGAETPPGPDSGARFVVVDCETTGLDASQDALIAIGAVAVCGGRVLASDSFEQVLRPPRTSGRDNILIHRIGQAAQRDGATPAEACTAFLAYAGDAPLVAFHASFDRAFLTRAVRDSLGRRLESRWLDLAGLAPALNPQVRAHALDEWLSHFSIEVSQRHHASADAFATAMLFLRLLAQVKPAERNMKSLAALAQAQRWAGGG